MQNHNIDKGKAKRYGLHWIKVARGHVTKNSFIAHPLKRKNNTVTGCIWLDLDEINCMQFLNQFHIIHIQSSLLTKSIPSDSIIQAIVKQSGQQYHLNECDMRHEICPLSL